MKFLLTSSGISNDSIHKALVDLLGKPIAESSALVIPTAWYAYPGGLAGVYQLIHGVAKSPLCEVGWKSLGVLELTALPSIKKENWVPLVQEVDACWLEEVRCFICAIGCGNRDWRTSCRSFRARPSMWG